tara:strand:+ start:1569 stop:2039 length:471 start_codon:yes stop_codon:yes gene_type:complete
MSYNALIETIKQTFESDSMVSTVVSGDATDVDNYKKNLFPLVHVEVTNMPFLGSQNTSTVDYNVVITVVDIRDVNKEEDRDKFWTNDNRNDNWNTTAFILRTGQVKMIKEIYGDNISLNGATAADKLDGVRANVLDGWQQTWTVSVPNIYIKACDV